MNSRNLAKKRLKNTIFRDRKDISSKDMLSLKEEITSLISELFTVEESSPELTTQKIDGKRIITYSVEIK